MKKILCLVLALSICICISGCSLSNDEYYRYYPQFLPSAEETVTLDNGDTFYTPEGAHVAIDDDRTIAYYNNLLGVYTYEDLTEDELTSLAQSVEGTVVGVVRNGIHFVQIKVTEADLAGLEAKAEALMTNDSVMFSCPEYPVQVMSETPEEETSEVYTEEDFRTESGIFNEYSDYTSDMWWQDAIGCEAAWEYSELCEEIRVGIIDTGYDETHSEFPESIVFVGDNNTNFDSHGDHCLGIMAAADDDTGIRGIADKATYYCADLWHDADANDSFHTIGELMAVYNYMAQNGVRVINNSWGCYIFNKKYYKGLSFGNSMDYDAWHELRSTTDLIPTAKASIVMIAQLVEAGYDDLIFVQAAGNGYYGENDDTHADAFTGGYFCTVTENIYNSLDASLKNHFTENGISYDTINTRIVIVGAVKQEQDKNGNYKGAYFTNYGETVDICAPGENIYSTLNKDYGYYGSTSGTSMAAPMVTASLAYVWSLDTSMTAEEVRELILTTNTVDAIITVDGNDYTYPMLDLGNAVETLMNK